MKRFALALAVLIGWIPTSAFAHGRSVSYSSWDLREDRATVTLRLSRLELTRLRDEVRGGPQLDPNLGRYLTSRLQLLAGDESCVVAAAPRALAAPTGKVAFEWELDCQGRSPTLIASQLFRDVAPGHLHFARLRVDGGPSVERVLALGEPEWRLASATAGAEPQGDGAVNVGTSIGAYLWLGMEHIATGYDHLVFLLALLLLATRLGEVATIVTGFTLAHSITLGLAVLGHVRPQSEAVEALIGLSIALVAAENAWLLSGRRRSVPWWIAGLLVALAAVAFAGFGALPTATLLGLALFSICYFAILERARRPIRVRIAIAFVFGLVHGFGFAGVLTEIALEPERLARALLGFNLGVEAGQLVAIALAWPVLRLATRAPDRRWLLEGGTAVIAGTGVFWLFSRALA